MNKHLQEGILGLAIKAQFLQGIGVGIILAVLLYDLVVHKTLTIELGIKGVVAIIIGVLFILVPQRAKNVVEK